MSVEARHHFTVIEYHRLAETGVLRPDARVELLNGEIIDMSPIGSFHGGVVARLTTLFIKASNDRWLTWPQNSLRLDEYSELQPDVALLKPSPDDYLAHNPGPEEAFLLIEVSDKTLGFDRNEKLSAYGRAGVKEVWIINLVEKIFEIYREPHFTGYASKTILRSGEFAKPQAFPDVTVSVSDLLK